nr:MAG TPA: hypothetical protein [Caudoviricetes sp.]
MTANPIKIEIVTSYISDVERILEAVRKLRKSNPDETLEVIIRVEKMCSTHKAIKADFKKSLDYLLLLQLLDQRTGKSLV